MELDDPSIASRKMYFPNECVEDLLRQYIWTSCTNIELRDQIMDTATELITQVIRKNNLHVIYPGHDESSFGDLVQTAWCQLEKTLYKFRAKPHCRLCYNPDRPNNSVLYEPVEFEYGVITFEELFKIEENEDRKGKFTIIDGKCGHCKSLLSSTPIVAPKQGLFGGSTTVLFRGASKVFNLWSQISRTVILAAVKREGRDKKNSGSYRGHLVNKTRFDEDKLDKFFNEANEIFKHNGDYIKCLQALRTITATDERPYDGLIGKLVFHSGLSRAQVSNFIKLIRLRSKDFTNSPLNKDPYKAARAAMNAQDDQDDDND